MFEIKNLYFYSVLILINTFLSGTRFFNLKRKLLNSIGVSVGEGTKIVGPIKVGPALKIEIGENNWIGANLTIHGNGSVFIGDNNDFAPEVTILTGSHESLIEPNCAVDEK